MPLTLQEAVLAQLPEHERAGQQWRVEALLAEMGFTPENLSLTAHTLSGGQHTRLLLARALMRNPDLLLLDEPGNHTDLPTLLWLEQFLQNWSGSFVVVSHDPQLLDAVTHGTGSCAIELSMPSICPVARRVRLWQKETSAMLCAIRLSKRR